MAEFHNKKMAAEIDEEFVVFLIGMRVNKFWKIHKWLPVVFQMKRMLRELKAHPELGFWGSYQSSFMFVQYWRSFEHLEAFARSKDHTHLPAWQAFYKNIGFNGDVGIWHETYQVTPGRYEAIYANMPAFGLGSVGKLVPASGRRDHARGRMQTPEAPPING